MSGVSEDLEGRRRRLLKRWLEACRLDWREAATVAGYDLVYFRQILTGSTPFSDRLAWRLRYQLGVPLDLLEEPLSESPEVRDILAMEVAGWKV